MDENELPSMTAEAALDAADLVLVDVRRRAARLADGRALVGVPWHDPENLQMAELPAGARLAFVCVWGHQVGQYAAAFARFHGREAVFVKGGFHGLVAAGAATETIGEPA
ncbi:MAG: hypothetical protein AAGE18_01215 [Pseudomonadota bacterium]